MPKIHIIYDPKDKLVHNIEMERDLGLKIAMMPIDEDASDIEIIRSAAEMLIRFMRNFTHE